MHPPLTPEQQRAYDFMVRAGLGARAAFAIICEGFFNVPDFCEKYSATSMLRIPNFGNASLRDVMNFAAKHKIPFKDDRLKPTVRPITAPKRISTLPEPVAPSVWLGPKWEYLVVDKLPFKGRDHAQAQLNAHGRMGWELCRVSRDALIFKRPAQ